MYVRNVCIHVYEKCLYIWYERGIVYIHDMKPCHVSTQETSTRVYEKCLYTWCERGIVYINDMKPCHVSVREMSTYMYMRNIYLQVLEKYLNSCIYQKCLYTCI